MKTNIAIIMCVWKRIENFQNTINMLKTQNDKDFTFYVWNNNVDIINNLHSLISNENDITISLKNSESNIGGIGRFYQSKMISDKHDIIIFIDDDQYFDNTMVSRFRSEFDLNSLKSRWSWRFNADTYNNRYKINSGGQKVHYCGTGGMVVSSHIFSCDKIFEIPEKYKYIEDLWLSYICDTTLGMNLVSINDDGFIRQVSDGKDQFLKLVDLKDEFMKYLIDVEKWKLR